MLYAKIYKKLLIINYSLLIITQNVAYLEATPGFEPGNQSFADSCLTTWLCRHTLLISLHYIICKLTVKSTKILQNKIFGAEDGAQTRDLCLGKASLYQLSYFRVP